MNIYHGIVIIRWPLFLFGTQIICFIVFSESNCVSPAAQCVDNGFLFMHVQDLLTIGDIVILRKGYGGGK